jgi:dihydrofolate synthase/folylpolyglutamate synthase
MTPEAFLAELEAARPEIDLGLDKSRQLLARVGNPQRKMRVVHVAGTNGKGSVCAMIAAALRAAGKRVGVYNSPHLVHWSESVTIDDEPNLDAWRASMRDIQRALGGVEHARSKYTAFEASCAAMWLQLASAQVDYAVVEAGVGGMRDATNVCDAVSAAVLTTVGLDHQDLLGSTIAEIARDKSGIFKPNCPAIVSSLLHPGAMPVVKLAAHQTCSEFILAPPARAKSLGSAEHEREDSEGGDRRLVWCGEEASKNGLDGSEQGQLEFSLGLLGDFQMANAGVALAALRALQR